jgi:hypothetical protein
LFLGVLFAGLLAGFVEQLAEGIAKALAGIEVNRWPRARGGFGGIGGIGGIGGGAGIAGVRLWRRGGIPGSGATWLFSAGGGVAELRVVELLFQEVRNGEGLL